jgi:protein phosphatase
MDTEAGGASRAGGAGLHNEDAFLVEQGLGLYVVCDGAGGAPAGEVAARIAAEALEDFIDWKIEELAREDADAARSLVERAMVHALDEIAHAERDDPKLDGLTTTITMLLAHGDLGVIGQRGDSRAYLIRRRRVAPLTVDHAQTEAAPTAVTEGSDFQVFAFPLEPRDTIVLCTDGAEAAVLDEAIARSAASLSPQLLASRIVSEAHRRNTSDDATAVVIRVRGEGEAGWLALSGEPRGTAFGHTLEPVSTDVEAERRERRTRG